MGNIKMYSAVKSITGAFDFGVVCCLGEDNMVLVVINDKKERKRYRMAWKNPIYIKPIENVLNKKQREFISRLEKINFFYDSSFCVHRPVILQLDSFDLYDVIHKKRKLFDFIPESLKIYK